jgi:hypothetical protein
MPISAQVRAVSTSPRRTTSDPIEVLTNFATAPSGPKNWRSRPGGFHRCRRERILVRQRLLERLEHLRLPGLVDLRFAGQHDHGEGLHQRAHQERPQRRFCASLIPVSICSSTNLSASASSEPLPSSVCCMNCLAPGAGIALVLQLVQARAQARQVSR